MKMQRRKQRGQDHRALQAMNGPGVRSVHFTCNRSHGEILSWGGHHLITSDTDLQKRIS